MDISVQFLIICKCNAYSSFHFIYVHRLKKTVNKLVSSFALFLRQAEYTHFDYCLQIVHVGDLVCHPGLVPALACDVTKL